MSENTTGMQVQDGPTDKAAATVANAEPTANSGPTTPGLATPMHVEPTPDVIAARLAPDPGRGGTRVIQTTTPIIGPVEGNIAMPDTGKMIAYPWAQMGVSDSFMVGYGVTEDALGKAAKQWASDANPEASFVVHRMADGARVWRVA